MTEEQLAAVRLYTSEEVVEKLGLKPTWLKNWITQNRVPHVRSGVDRGVRFTAADIFEIGRMLPELLGGRRGGSAVGDKQAWNAVAGQPGSVWLSSSPATLNAVPRPRRRHRGSTSSPGAS
jgi:predicted DNA-binding transcriptional regulator AlpA